MKNENVVRARTSRENGALWRLEIFNTTYRKSFKMKMERAKLQILARLTSEEDKFFEKVQLSNLNRV